MEQLALEPIQPGDARPGRSIQLAAGTDQRLGAQAFAAAGAHLPGAAGGIELGARHLAVETDMPTQAVLVGAVALVGEDLRLGRELARPIGLGFEGE
ncbi:hypothetical protein D9M68_871320 [compost metagenome]